MALDNASAAPSHVKRRVNGAAGRGCFHLKAASGSNNNEEGKCHWVGGLADRGWWFAGWAPAGRELGHDWCWRVVWWWCGVAGPGCVWWWCGCVVVLPGSAIGACVLACPGPQIISHKTGFRKAVPSLRFRNRNKGPKRKAPAGARAGDQAGRATSYRRLTPRRRVPMRWWFRPSNRVAATACSQIVRASSSEAAWITIRGYLSRDP